MNSRAATQQLIAAVDNLVNHWERNLTEAMGELVKAKEEAREALRQEPKPDAKLQARVKRLERCLCAVQDILAERSEEIERFSGHSMRDDAECITLTRAINRIGRSLPKASEGKPATLWPFGKEAA